MKAIGGLPPLAIGNLSSQTTESAWSAWTQHKPGQKKGRWNVLTVHDQRASPLLSLLLQNLICDSKQDQKSGTHTPSPTHTHFFLLSSILTYFFGRYPPPLLSKFLDPLPLISPLWDSVRRGLLYLPVRDLRKAVRERQAGGRGATPHQHVVFDNTCCISRIC